MNFEVSGQTGKVIPFLELRQCIDEMRPELDTAYARVLASGCFILGAEVEAFERELAAVCGADHAVGVGNGLDALTLILRGLGIGPGDEVIVPANTCIATWLAVSAAGGQIVPVEPDPESYNINPRLVELAITNRTAAILPVHLYGHCADMTSLARIGRRYGLPIIVDAAQAIGAQFLGESKKTIGHAAAFSFYPTKNVGAIGDGGAIVTDDKILADKIRKLRNYGCVSKDHHEIIGVNSRLDALQAAFIRCRLARMKEWNSRRARLADRYLRRLSDLPSLSLPTTHPDARHVWHLFTIRVVHGRRDELRRFLHGEGVGTGIYYPTPPHQSQAYADMRSQFQPLPVTERLAESILSLPLHPHLTEGEVDRVCDLISDWHERG